MAEAAREGTIRKAVHDAVRKYPGIHVRGLERQIGESAPLVQYHLKRLEEEGFVVSREQGGYTRYYTTRKAKSARVTERDLPLVGLLREEVPLHIVLLLLDEGPRTHGELVEKLGMAKSTVSYHLAKLAQEGIVGREKGSPRITLIDRGRIYKLLLAYTPTPDLLDSFASLWEDLYG
ncbi:MAG: ArsR family transcriptional regulator [Candidatus Thermoplasmatota archaeon]